MTRHTHVGDAPIVQARPQLGRPKWWLKLEPHWHAPRADGLAVTGTLRVTIGGWSPNGRSGRLERLRDGRWSGPERRHGFAVFGRATPSPATPSRMNNDRRGQNTDVRETTVVEELYGATRRLVRSVDRLDNAAWRSPSLLPTWTRAHLVAHLVLNAEGLTAALEGLLTDAAAPMYVSSEARDRDIEELALDDVGPVRDRLIASATGFADALARLTEEHWPAMVERVPGGQRFAAAALPAMRWREVEIHHADLDCGYTRHHWDLAFAEVAVDYLAMRQSQHGRSFVAVLTDAGRTLEVGGVSPRSPQVRGSAADLAWWLSGRGAGEGLTCDGEVPKLGAW